MDLRKKSFQTNASITDSSLKQQLSLQRGAPANRKMSEQPQFESKLIIPKKSANDAKQKQATLFKLEPLEITDQIV